MHRDLVRICSLATASATIGWIGWSGSALCLPAAVVFPALWSLTRTRWQAATVSAAYFLAASRGLPQGVSNFYASDLWPGILLWLIASFTFVAVHVVLWTNRGDWRKSVRYLVACVAMAVPPFGILGWAHPITAAGVLFPEWGWCGLAAMAAGLAVMTTRHRPAAAMAVTGLWLWSAAQWTVPNSPASLVGVDLDLGATLGRDTGLERQSELVGIAQKYPPGSTVVLPESAIGFWTPTVARFWRSGLEGSGVTVIAGAAEVEGNGYDNVLVKISPDGSDIIYRERMPVPGSMWQPWRQLLGRQGGAQAHFFADPVVDVGGTTIAPLICYEQLLVWPILQSVLHRPDVIVATGNGWWTAGTSIIDIQRASSAAWARLFGLPLVISFNT